MTLTPILIIVFIIAILAAILLAMSRPRGTKPVRLVSIDWNVTSVASLRDAEDWFDWLEAGGIRDRELVILGPSEYAVRWR